MRFSFSPDAPMTSHIDIGHRRHRFTVDEYHRMAQAGIFGEDDRIELIDGEIVEMTPIGSQHAGIVGRLNRLFVEQLDASRVVWPQNPIRLGDHSEPEPDLAILRSSEDDYLSDHPGPEDVLLIVEVADTSIADDRDIKVPLYATHAIPVVWLADLGAGTIEVYSDPADGEYRSHKTVARDADIPVETVPELVLTPGQVLA